jgi:UDP-glucose 4-epimerase
LRLFNAFGTRQTYTPYVGVVTIFVRNILAHSPCVILGDGAQCRDFVSVHDVSSSLALAADSSGAAGRVINIGSGVGTTVNQLAEMLRERMPSARFDHADPVAGEPRHSVADVRLATEVLGYRPTRLLGDDLDEVIRWWSDNPVGR